jgi:hypothetical protein
MVRSSNQGDLELKKLYLSLGSKGKGAFLSGDPLGELKLIKNIYKNPRGDKGDCAISGGEGQGEL